MRTDSSKTMVEAFWKSKGVTVKSQLQKLAGMANTRKLYGDFKRIELKLEQVLTLRPS